MSNLFGVGRGPQIYKIGISMGVTIGGDAEIFCKNAHLLVIMRMRLLQKIGLIDLTNRTRLKKRKRIENTYENCAQLMRNLFNVT